MKKIRNNVVMTLIAIVSLVTVAFAVVSYKGTVTEIPDYDDLSVTEQYSHSEVITEESTTAATTAPITISKKPTQTTQSTTADNYFFTGTTKRPERIVITAS